MAGGGEPRARRFASMENALELARESGWHSVSHLTAVGGVSATACSKHVAVLRQCGLVERGPGRLYRLPGSLRPLPDAEVLDLGVCAVRLRLPGPPAPA